MKCYSCGSKMISSKETYNYSESGIPYLYLANVEVRKCTKCNEKAVVLPRIDELHGVIANMLLCKKVPLTGKEVRFLRKEMDLIGTALANLLGVTPVTVSRWENEKEPISATSDRLVRVIYVQLMQERCKSVFPGILPILEAIELKPKSKRAEKLTIKMPLKKHSGCDSLVCA